MLRRGLLVAEVDHAVVLGEGLGVAPQFGGERALGAGPERGQQPARLDARRGQQGEMQVGLVDRAERGFEHRALLRVLSVLSRLIDLGARATRACRARDGRREMVDAAVGDECVGAVEQAGHPADAS